MRYIYTVRYGLPFEIDSSTIGGFYESDFFDPTRDNLVPGDHDWGQHQLRPERIISVKDRADAEWELTRNDGDDEVCKLIREWIADDEFHEGQDICRERRDREIAAGN